MTTMKETYLLGLANVLVPSNGSLEEEAMAIYKVYEDGKVLYVVDPLDVERFIDKGGFRLKQSIL